MNPTRRTDSAESVIQWRVHPARERIGACCAALAVMFLMAYLSQALMQSVAWAVLALVVQAFALRRFLLPSEFQLDREGVTARTGWSSRRYRWADIRRFQCDERGGFLSTRECGSPLDLFRGMHLIFGRDREAAVAGIRERLRAEAES